MGCRLTPDQCRTSHVAVHLEDVTPDGADFEARCPACHHGGFRISRPTRSRTLRHVWTCACKRCRCDPAVIRGALLRRSILAACLGAYDGSKSREIPQDAARAMNRAIADILITPGLKPSDVRLIIAEAQGRKIPEDEREFVRFARSIGIGRSQACEAAARWCRPSDCPPQTRGGVVDTSRSTGPRNGVKQPMSQARNRPETGQNSESAIRKPDDSSGEQRPETGLDAA